MAKTVRVHSNDSWPVAPLCGEDNNLKGLSVDRDIVVEVIAAANDPRAVHVGELAQGQAITAGAEDMLGTIRRHQVRRLPVMDGPRTIGVVVLADVARALSDPPVGALVEALPVDR
ncbi:MAG TPA: CBS domain-containing protein [Pseudonocardiaceae bacterium]|nr:CBS domain-containing protein [Pseudonocardiaceae bacterium]